VLPVFFHSATNDNVLFRKKAGAVDDGADGRGIISGMTEASKERARAALAGRTGDTDDEDD
jgi:hypothetical protein